MFFLLIIPCFLIAARASFRMRVNVLDTLSVTMAGLLLVVYVLSFFGMASWAVVLAVAPLGAIFAEISQKNTGDRQDFPKKVLTEDGEEAIITRENSALEIARYILTLANPMLFFYIACIFVVGYLVKGNVFTWWDDINFWASDAKQIFYLNGFAPKYGNVSPEFGDYPPIVSIGKWLFLILNRKSYTEGLQFVGYFAMNLTFMLPLLSKIDVLLGGRYRLYKFIAGIFFGIVALFPGVFNGIIYYGTPADITMAIVYGALLLAIYDKEEVSDNYYFLRIFIYMSVLLLTKSVAFEWALFAVIFYLLVGKKNKKFLIALGGAAVMYGGWLSYCLINRRIAKLTGAGIKMATSGYTAPANTAEKLKYFVQGFWLMPMHGDRNFTLDISTGTAVVLIFAFVLALWYIKVFTGKEAARMAIFLLITGVIAYGIVFVAHISIFQTEDQYLDAYAMSVSIARYCAPFTLGSTYLLSGIMFEKMSEGFPARTAINAVIVWALVILLTADYAGVYRHVYGYTENLGSDRDYYLEMVGDEGRTIVEDVRSPEYYGKRILVLRDGHFYYWVHNAYINKEASPVALVYDGYKVEEDTVDTIKQKIRTSHASYIYVEDPENTASELFSQLLGEKDYAPGNVYEVDDIIN